MSGGCLARTRTSGLECSSSAAKVFYLKACALLEEKATVLYPSHFAYLFSEGQYAANSVRIAVGLSAVVPGFRGTAPIFDAACFIRNERFSL